MTTLEKTGFASGDAPRRAEEPGSAHGVDGAFQLGFAAKFGLAMVCGSAAAGLVVYAMLARELGAYAQSMAVISGVQRSVLGASVLSALIQFVVAGLVVTFVALFASHKIAGPLLRLTRMLRGVREGKLPGEARLRSGDQVGMLETRFNEISQGFTERHAALERRLAEVRAAEQELRQTLSQPGSPGDASAAADQLRKRTAELARELDPIQGSGGGRRAEGAGL